MKELVAQAVPRLLKKDAILALYPAQSGKVWFARSISPEHLHVEFSQKGNRALVL